MVIEQTERIGFEIGGSDELNAKVEELLPDTEQLPAGKVQVGPSTSAQLIADPNDAEITPSEAVNASTSEDVALLWTWFVRPKRPTENLVLTVRIEVPTESGVFATEEPLEIPVRRTLSYTAGQLFTNWTTWAGIVAALAGGARLLWLQRDKMEQNKKRNKPASEDTGPPDRAETATTVGSGTSTQADRQPTSPGSDSTESAETQPP